VDDCEPLPPLATRDAAAVKKQGSEVKRRFPITGVSRAPVPRGLHSSNSRLTVSTFVGYVGSVAGVSDQKRLRLS
jgi:hypothetical protein